MVRRDDYERWNVKAELTASQVDSRESFIKFLTSIMVRVREDPTSISNSTLVEFLDGVSAWTSDMHGYSLNRGDSIPTEPTWCLFAQVFEAGLFYE